MKVIAFEGIFFLQGLEPAELIVSFQTWHHNRAISKDRKHNPGNLGPGVTSCSSCGGRGINGALEITGFF
jgi:hypothetical protein